MINHRYLLKMESTNSVNFQCLLCKEFLNGKLDNNFSEHMEYHNIKFNQEFIFSTFFLSHKGIEKTVEFMLNYSESEAQAGNSSGTKKTFLSDSVADTEEEIIVPDIPRDSTEDTISDAGQGKDMIEIEDDETWNLWNEDEIRRATRSSPIIPYDKTEKEDEPDFRWESATSRRSISRSSKVIASSEEERICHCNLNFPDAAAKARHMIRLHNKFKCPECPLTYASSSGLQYHMQHSEGKHDPDYGKTQCAICGAHFKSYKFLKEHRTAVHKIGDKKSCPYCGEKIYDVRKHLREAHNVAQDCEICGKKVKDLELHYKTVHGADEDKSFRCATCNKGFVLKEKLIAHQLVHSDERPFKCKFGCGFGAKTAGNCKKHEESKHTRKRLYVDGKPLRMISNIKNNGKRQHNGLQDKVQRSDNTTMYKTRFRDVKDEILDEVVIKSEEEVVDVMVEVCPIGKTDPRVGISLCTQMKKEDPKIYCEIMESGNQIAPYQPKHISSVRARIIKPTLDMEVDDIDDYEPVS